jgi:UDP-glucose 4-epimerase
MKRILITGKNSYIGTSFERWVSQYPDKYSVDTIDMKDESWKNVSFANYDSVFHVAGIAHIKESKKNKDLYYKVNRDLTYEIAKKAKSDGVKQFIFLSSMSVYGLEIGTINEHTPLKPNSYYGKSKIEAEELIKPLESNLFKVTILRPPMIYGKGCKGNYQRLVKIALKTPIFPDINNSRSMLYIDNLSEFVKQLIDNNDSGLFFPQNKEYVKTSEMVKLIAMAHGRYIKKTKLFNPLLRILKIGTINKVFGDLVYEKSMSNYKKKYSFYNFLETISLTEKGE